ncbi:MAG: hypothetical protein K2O06_00965 [Acetatifactor sp.]|nr:hypothetical protein [Acetatifactor sp.]
MKEILLTGFRGTSSEWLVKKADCKSLILPNDKILDAQILLSEIYLHDYKYIFSFGQKPNIRDKVYIETAARKGSRCLHTDFAYGKLQDTLRAENIIVHISDHAGTSFCNALYWNVLEYIHNRERKTKIIFLHIPFCKNMTSSEDFCERILKGIKKYC